MEQCIVTLLRSVTFYFSLSKDCIRTSYFQTLLNPIFYVCMTFIFLGQSNWLVEAQKHAHKVGTYVGNFVL